ncbi:MULTISPECIES: DUF3800 domain-containing protein [unclassified Methylophaga]|jgi:hypothetical protein|uniref:DUF3800 domain-containing protein n=1 Tax=unclassified Methylophaga TaxID=2629249 RepID=UPI00259C6E19|nr:MULTISPECIES: DUF3800 domain-containing protein [unclassified Methylophaga]|tara:strand:+ start:892 stop:1911 length:1020 start_codon:yes stop_codon:yes gene_type:complete
MNIAIDESGNFSYGVNSNSWSVIAAYCFTERQKSDLYSILGKMKKNEGFSKSQEVKLNDLTEENYFDFLNELSHLDGKVFAIVTDTSLSQDDHRKHLQDKLKYIFINASKNMSNAHDAKTYLNWAQMIEELSPQLFYQFICMRDLINAIIVNGLAYFGELAPDSLRTFKWIIDPKDIQITRYERLIDTVIPIIIDKEAEQKKEYRAKLLFDGNYGYMEKYILSSVQNMDDTSIESNDAINLQTLFRNNLRFPDSKNSNPIQVADLVSAGIRRVLKSGFNNNDRACELLGRLLLKPTHSKNSVMNVVIHESPENVRLDSHTSQIIKKLNQHSTKLFVRRQ